ncbi:MAG: hypothetical protein ICV87_05130 [Gemmatimonadetes bacterium]|nr:hypothetical protein [Gemmatimonadota bacterium]
MSRASRATRIWLSLLAAATLWGTLAAGAQAPAARPFMAVPVQGLTFGQLLPGVAQSIPVTDASRRAEIMVTGSGRIDLVLVLPEAMVSRTGARLPLRIGPADGAILQSAGAAPVPVNPLEPIRLDLDAAGGQVRLLLGGTVFPAQGQPAGAYGTRLRLVSISAGT